MNSGQSWPRVIQGTRHFRWESSKAINEDIVALEEIFFQVIAFSSAEVSQARTKLESTLVERFLERGFPLEFIQKELKLRWSLRRDLFVSSLSKGILLFRLQFEEKDRVSTNGPRSLTDQLLALEEWWLKFKPSQDGVHQVRVWIRLPDYRLIYRKLIKF